MHFNRPVGRHLIHWQQVAGLVLEGTGALTLNAVTQIATGRIHGAGKARVHSGGVRRARRIRAVSRHAEQQGFRASRVTVQVFHTVGERDLILGAECQRLLRGEDQRGPIQGPVERHRRPLVGESDTDAGFNAVLIRGFTEIEDNGITGAEAVRIVTGLPALQGGPGDIHRRRRGILLIQVGFHMEAEYAKGGFDTEHFRLDHTQGIDLHTPLFDDGTAHQLHLQQGLGEGAVGTGIGSGKRQIQGQHDAARRFRAGTVGGRQQVAGGIGQEAHRHLAGIKAGGQLATDQDFQRRAF